MGFGWLIVGYFMVHIMAVNSTFSVAMLLGYPLMIAGLFRLAPYQKRLFYAFCFSFFSLPFAVYYALNTLLKLPFSKEWLDSGELSANLVRTARYAVILFILLAIYPKAFPLFEKAGRKQ